MFAPYDTGKSVYLRTMRFLIAIGVCLLLIGPAWFARQALHKQVRLARREVKAMVLQGLPRETLKELRFHRKDASGLYWEHSSEFRYDGQMYDVVESSAEGDTLIYLCFEDRKETALRQRLTALLQLNPVKPADQDRHRVIDQFFKGFFRPNLDAPPVAGTFDLLLHPGYSEEPSDGYPARSTPPPSVS